MAKTYKDYCREAVARDPKTYGSMFNPDGSRKAPPSLADIYKKKAVRDIPREELAHMKKDGPAFLRKEDKPELEVRGMEIKVKGRMLNLTMLEMPANPTRKQYNRVWMHNQRIRDKIKKLKKQYGAAIPF